MSGTRNSEARCGRLRAQFDAPARARSRSEMIRLLVEVEVSDASLLAIRPSRTRGGSQLTIWSRKHPKLRHDPDR